VKVRFTLVVLFLMLALAAPALAQKPTPFSADMKMTMGNGMGMDGKVYFGGEKIRMEMNTPRGQSVTIVDAPKQTTYLLMPEQKMYMEMNAATAQRRRTPELKPMDINNPCANAPNTTCKKVGTETVNGRSCDKWEFTTSGRTTTYWIDQKLYFPIKMTGEGSTWELTNIKEGPQDVKLFEIPSDYQKMDMGGMMGGRGPGNQ
jgi:outer membrane lipoprotein-sorting protein